MMTHGSLFSGIGGFDLAAEWMGWKNLFHCEWNEFGQKVLKYYWPDAELFTDITKSNFTKYANKIDILTGGFPCQPYSQAGKRLGKDDERHLWPEMLRVIQEVKPTYIVGENVRGLTNWNGGVVFEEVCVDLENCGYQVQPVLLPACSVNAPHRRDRIWFVAYSNKCTTGPSRTSERTFRNWSNNNDEQKERGKQTEQHIGCSNVLWDATYTDSRRLERSKEVRRNGINVEWESEFGDASNTSNKGLQGESNKGEDRGTKGEWSDNGRRNVTRIFRSRWEEFPTESPLCDGNDGISDRLDSITFPKWRNESIKAGGNAIVPQVAFQIFKTIQQHENNKTKASADL